jgi:hypothetical protein
MPRAAPRRPSARSLRFLLGQADIVEAIEHAMLAVRVDLKTNDAAVGTANFLLLQIDR